MKYQNLPEWLKLEIGRMLLEGVSDEGIQVVVDNWKRERAINPFTAYAAFVEYGLPPVDNSKTVEGSITEPITQVIAERKTEQER